MEIEMAKLGNFEYIWVLGLRKGLILGWARFRGLG